MEGTDWQTWTEIGVRVDGLPAHFTTFDVYEIFQTEGNISRIELGKSSSCAFINFSPPPHRAFWKNGSVRVLYEHRSRMLNCCLLPERRLQYPSPVDPSRSYDTVTIIPIAALAFGVMLSDSAFAAMRRALPKSAELSNVQMNLRYQELTVRFTLPGHLVGNDIDPQALKDEAAEFRFKFRISDLDCIYENDSADHADLILTTAIPPEYYRKSKDVKATHDASSTEWLESYTWNRQTDICADADHLAQKSVALSKRGAVLDIGRWTTFRIRLNLSTSSNKAKYNMFRQAIMDYNIRFIINDAVQYVDGHGIEPSLWDSYDSHQRPGSGQSVNWLNSKTTFLPFPVQYQLEVCISRKAINEYNVTDDFVQRLALTGEEAARVILEKVVERSTEKNIWFHEPMKIFENRFLRERRRPTKRSDGHYAYMRAVTITPSTVVYSTPILETSNRIIRHFSAYEDRFLRVRFSDERSKIWPSDREIQEALYARIRRVLTQGIRIGDRKYDFLAFGNSQFRENGAYFFANTSDMTTAHIRAWMGDLKDIRSISKWAARLGQSFSTSRSIHGVRVKVRTENDIIYNGYNFTDGVGKISPFLAKLIASEFRVQNFNSDYPSVFQFRMGGCKGVLAVDPSLEGSQEVIIRESQYKFPAAHEGLDVIRLSAFAVSTLNRQLILILDTLGVPPEIFCEKQKAELFELEQAMSDRQTAHRLLQGRVDFNQMTLTLAKLIDDGFMESKEPFVMSILRLWRAWNVKYLKEKARLTIDQGAFLLGCVDETATLKGHFSPDQRTQELYGDDRGQQIPEVFLQIRDPPRTGAYKPKKGLCILTRNPALHPGDIRVVRAVDVPALHHLKDVVVFPQTGDRDLPSMCSGGDLDGDDYLVMWDEDLFPPRSEWNRAPMDFHPPRSEQLERQVTIEDASDFFIKYMKYNNLERIATSHLIHADRSDDGVDDFRCLELAELHSCAVDFPKSGVPAHYPRRLMHGLRPHFMAKPGQKFYPSNGVLGRLYDEVELVEFKPQHELSFESRILNAYDLSSKSMRDIAERVKPIKQDYDDAVRRIMAKHSINSEFEVWSTFVLQHNMEKNHYKFHEEIGNLSTALKDQFRAICIEEAGGESLEVLGPWIATMYKVTADEVERGVADRRARGATSDTTEGVVDETPMPFMSFPWIFFSELGKIARGASGIHPHQPTHATISGPNANEKKQQHKALAAAVEDDLIDLDAPSGVVHPGEELRLFGDTAPAAAESQPANEELPAQANEDFVMQDHGIEIDSEDLMSFKEIAEIRMKSGIEEESGDEAGSSDEDLSEGEIGASPLDRFIAMHC